MERSWSRLPPDLLNLISHNLRDIADFTRFRFVCSSWRSAADPSDLPPQPPWLMLPLPFLADGPQEFFSLFPAGDNPRRLNLPEARGKPWVAACHGWLLIHSNFDPPFLLNPLTRSQIALPPLLAEKTSEQPREWPYIFLASVSSNPSGEGTTFEVMIALSSAKNLAFCRPGDATWTAVDSGAFKGFGTMTYFNGEFYAVDGGGTVVACGLGSSPPSLKTVISLPKRYRFNRCYLVVSKGELLLVIRYWSNKDKGPRELFGVLKLIKDEEKHNWLQMKSIGDRAIFVSDNNSLAISASGVTGCRPNCVYYADPFFEAEELSQQNLYFSEFNMGDGSLKMIPCYLNQASVWWEPLWLLPSLC